MKRWKWCRFLPTRLVLLVAGSAVACINVYTQAPEEASPGHVWAADNREQVTIVWRNGTWKGGLDGAYT